MVRIPYEEQFMRQQKEQDVGENEMASILIPKVD